jgi:hypothetical protein
VKRTTIESLEGCARFLREHHPSGAPDADFVTFGMATEFLRASVDNEWTNQMVFGEHSTVARSNRQGRVFMRAEAPAADERYRNQQRALRIAELLFNLQDVEGIDAKVEELRSGNVESTYSELEAGARSSSDGLCNSGTSRHPARRAPTMTLKSRCRRPPR